MQNTKSPLLANFENDAISVVIFGYDSEAWFTTTLQSVSPEYSQVILPLPCVL